MKAFSANTTTIMSFLNFTLLINWFLLKVISVRFFFSWSSQMTTLFLYYSKTITIILVLYIISTNATGFDSCTFFFIFNPPRSFCTISKPLSVATAKYSCVWFDVILLILALDKSSAVSYWPSSVVWGASCADFSRYTALNFSTCSLSMMPDLVLRVKPSACVSYIIF